MKPRLIVLGAAAIVVIVVAAYAFTGSAGRAGPAAVVDETSANGQAAAQAARMTDVLDRLELRLRGQPDDPAGWALLARAYAALGKPMQALPAFQKALALAPDDAGLMADCVDAMAARDFGKFNSEAQRMVARALSIEPDNPKALALSGSIAFDKLDYGGAVRLWSRVEKMLPADSKMLVQVRASLAQARKLGGLPVEAAPHSPAS